MCKKTNVGMGHFIIKYSFNLMQNLWSQFLFSIIVRHIFIRVHTKIKFCCKCVHSQVIRDVDEFVSLSDLEKCSIASLSNGCSAVNGCHQNESPNTRCDGANPGGLHWCRDPDGSEV